MTKLTKLFNTLVQRSSLITSAMAGMAILNLGLTVLGNEAGAFSYPFDFDTSFKLAAVTISMSVPFVLGTTVHQGVGDSVAEKERERRRNRPSRGTGPYSMGPY